MALQTTLRWLLGIGETSRYIDDDILDFVYNDIQENEGTSNFSILQLLQEVYYVDQLNYLCPERFVTYADACKTNKAYQPRRFSCCERKTLAEFDWQDVESYVMIVKYLPCELCQLPVYMHTRKYFGIVNAGIKCNLLEKKPLINAIAEEIYKEIH